MKIRLDGDFQLYVHDGSRDRFVVYKGATIPLKCDAFILNDLGDCCLEEEGWVSEVDGDVDLFRLSTRATIHTEFGKKKLISKDLKKASTFARNVNQLIGEPIDREINATSSRRWKAKLCRDISEVKEGNRFTLCRWTDGVWFLFK
jgi:hypothetical protein